MIRPGGHSAAFAGGIPTPQRHRQPYPREFPERLVELIRAGRTPEELAEAFEPSAQTIRNWVAQADRDAGRRPDGLTSARHAELRKLGRANRRPTIERDILSRATARFAQETEVVPPKSSDSGPRTRRISRSR